MNINEFLKNLGFGTVALIAGESLLSSCMGVMDMGESVAPIVSDGEFINALRISETISGTGPPKVFKMNYLWVKELGLKAIEMVF